MLLIVFHPTVITVIARLVVVLVVQWVIGRLGVVQVAIEEVTEAVGALVVVVVPCVGRFL